jgi:transcription elongation factor Elf1
MNTRKALIATAAVFVLAAITGVAALLFPGMTAAMRIFFTAVSFGGLAICAVVSAIVIEKKRLVPVMIAAIVSAAGAFILWSLLVWEIINSWGTEELAAKSAGSLTTAAFVFPIVGLLMLPRLTMSLARWMRIATVISLCIAAIIINTGFWELWPNNMEEFFFRCAGIAGVVAAAGIICTPILYKLQATRPAEADARPIPISLDCPRCNTPVSAKHGISKCGSCGLRITIKIEEPRCACGYALYGLAADSCPECGRTIAESDKWLAPVSNTKNEKPAPDPSEAGS